MENGDRKINSRKTKPLKKKTNKCFVSKFSLSRIHTFSLEIGEIYDLSLAKTEHWYEKDNSSFFIKTPQNSKLFGKVLLQSILNKT